jgi:uncharacterized protein (TIGR00369 family)
MNPLMELGTSVLAQQPFSVLLGTELVEFEPGKALLHLPLRTELLQQHGYAHGGVLSYLSDNALTFAGGSVLGAGVLTAEYKINFLRPARGAALLARASVLEAGRKQAVCRCDVFVLDAGAETLCATALGTIVRLPERDFDPPAT